jgi:hypothetical protein
MIVKWRPSASKRPVTWKWFHVAQSMASQGGARSHGDDGASQEGSCNRLAGGL